MEDVAECGHVWCWIMDQERVLFALLLAALSVLQQFTYLGLPMTADQDFIDIL